MPAWDKSGSALIHPSGYSLADLEMAKFTVENGTAFLNSGVQIGTITVGTVVSGYAEFGTAGTITGNAIVFRETGGTLNAVGTAHPLPIQEQFAPGYEDNTNSVAANLQKPVASSTYAPTEYASLGGAGGTGVLIKATPANVYAVYVTSGTNAIRYFQMFNQATVAVLGQTPVASYPLGSVAAGGIAVLQLSSPDFAPSRYFSTGLAVAISSTQGTLGTASITAADYNIHVKYV